MTIRGTCDACGKVYRLPAAGREYHCKACGGTLRADDDAPEERVEDHAAAAPHHETAREHRERIDARRRAAARKTRLVWGTVLVVIVALGAFGYQTFRTKPEAPRAVPATEAGLAAPPSAPQDG